MTYKLKDDVTEEMLVKEGFNFDRSLDMLTHGIKMIDSKEIYVCLKWENFPSRNGMICWDSDEVTDDITPYIQDLISLGYVVEV